MYSLKRYPKHLPKPPKVPVVDEAAVVAEVEHLEKELEKRKGLRKAKERGTPTRKPVRF